MALVPCEEVVVSALLITVVAGPCAHLNYFTEYLLPSTSTGSQSNRKSKLLAAPDRLSIVLKIPCFKWRGLMLVEVMLSFLLAMQLGFLIYGCEDHKYKCSKVISLGGHAVARDPSFVLEDRNQILIVLK